MPGTDFLREFAKIFTNLNRSQQSELERALLDVQDSKELTNLETSITLLKRNVDQRLPIPQLSVYPTIRGAAIEWDTLNDQRIGLYDVDVSSTNTFASFDTFPTYGNSIVLDGLTATRFVRVRGVRRDGTTTPYSETATVSPELFDITSHTDEDFYITITDVDPVTVCSLSYTPINENGNSLVWGMVSIYADPAVGAYGTAQVIAAVNAQVLDENGLEVSNTEVWRVTCGEHFQTHGIGPFTVAHPTLNYSLVITLDVTDSTTLDDGTPRNGDRTEVYWAHLNALELGVSA